MRTPATDGQGTRAGSSHVRPATGPRVQGLADDPYNLTPSPRSPSPMDTARTLLFGVLALQADLIDPECFARACTLWSAQRATPLADLMVQQGWLTPEDRADVERLLERKLKKHAGNAR